MDNDKAIKSRELVLAYLSTKSFCTDQQELIQRALDSMSLFGNSLDNITRYQTEWLRSISSSIDHASKMSQQLSQYIDMSAIARQTADIIHRQNFQVTADLVKEISISLPERFITFGNLFPSDEVKQRCIATLEKATPYMPDEVNQEIQENVITPAKKNQLSIDTLLSIIAIVLTVLIFAFEQVSDCISKQENEKDLDALCQSNQQLASDIEELSRTIQQLTDEVSELNNCLDSFREVALNEDDSDCKKSEADSLDQIDDNQQPEKAF